MTIRERLNQIANDLTGLRILVETSKAEVDFRDAVMGNSLDETMITITSELSALNTDRIDVYRKIMAIKKKITDKCKTDLDS